MQVQSEGMVSEEGSNLERRKMPSTPSHENRSGSRPFSEKYPSFPPWEVPMINAEGVMEMQPIPRVSRVPFVPWTGGPVILWLSIIVCVFFLCIKTWKPVLIISLFGVA